jgi:TolB protein
MTFDAFYAASVHRVTSQMHAQSQDDPLADHAIREAYARAYQQWYEVSTYPDPEAWVLQAAADAYERRRAEAGSTGLPSSLAGDADSGTWPGIYRPRETAEPMDPDATIAPALSADPQSWRPRAGAAAATPQSMFGPGPSNVAQEGPPLPDTAQVQGSGVAWGGGRVAGRRPGFGAQVPPRRGRSPRGLVVAIVAVVVLAVAVVGYMAYGHRQSGNTTGQNPGAGVNSPGSQLLPYGHTGSKATVPWNSVGAGWTLTELSTAQPGSNGSPGAGGKATFYLVDPLGGKYLIHSWPGSAAPILLFWSGDKMNALYASGGTGGYWLLHLPTGTVTKLTLPQDVVPAGFSRPDGKNVLAVDEHGRKLELQRYDLNGNFQATLAKLPANNTQPAWPACGMHCGALSSPDGLYDVWGIGGEEMQLVSNAGGHAHKLPVPDSGKPPSCVPITWWDKQTILATCAAVGQPDPNSQSLWLVPDGGGNPMQLSAPSGTASGTGFDQGAWQLADGTRFVTQTTSNQCAGAASGPGGLAISRLSPDQTQAPVTIAHTTSNRNSIVASVGNRLLVLAQTSCPGSSSLLWYEPASGKATMLLPSPPNQAGVVVAVPYGSGPTAMSVG